MGNRRIVRVHSDKIKTPRGQLAVVGDPASANKAVYIPAIPLGKKGEVYMKALADLEAVEPDEKDQEQSVNKFEFLQKLQQASVAFQKRLPPPSIEPSGYM